MRKRIRLESKAVQFQGKIGLVAFVLVLLLGGYRATTMQNSKDPKLHAAMKKILVRNLQSEVAQSEDLYDMSDEEDLVLFTQMLTNPEVTIEKLSISRPLLSFGSAETVIVKVLYKPYEEEQVQEEYHKFSYSSIFGWRHRFESDVIRFYMNFF